MDQSLIVDIVVIGRNAARQLVENFRVKPEAAVIGQWIYCDSASSDNSVQIAGDLGFNTISITQASRLSPALGRYLGTRKATAPYILFLDSDMEFTGFESLQAAIQDLEQIKQKGGNVAGLCGSTIDVFPNGSRHQRPAKRYPGNRLRHFGGMLLINREVLLDAGNWDFRVNGNEETELHARILKSGYNIKFDKRISCRHHTDKPNPLWYLIAAYWPWSRFSRFYGAGGLAFKASLQHNSAREFLALNPEAPVTLLTIFLLILMLTAQSWTGLLVILAGYILFIGKLRSWRYLAVCPGLAWQWLWGLFIPLKVAYKSKETTDHPKASKLSGSHE